MSWWGTSEPEEVLYDELPTPEGEEAIRALGEEAVKEILEVFGSDDGWTELPFEEEGHSDIKLFDKPDEGSEIVPVKAAGPINAPAEKVFNIFAEDDLEKLKATHDPDILELEMLETFGDVTVRFSSFYVAAVVSNREFVYVQVNRKLDDGSYVMATKSINRPGKKVVSGNVRGVVSLAGAQIVPDKEDPQKCMVYRSVMVNPKGSIPGWVVNMSKSKCAQKIVAVRGLV
mmetsp:Transcript_3711/g.10173  ORF Transcript_3711/g.10173 Transcript_3711/m.10173 type:complete len:230 (+) Transcript_3711:75-764(+)|eukprot:CAMPEP_0119133338 /NCGR_PEP_ID=MMETSP1310-20130426/13321_1 /TAXON_ID=464262 /ORGANISM="Genus nov. species nov., Strain RCC2339" /LENGTH=229 /DNA_ID=CAMNT_0007124025 /DNA_START=73 /DNA_END=762 /DNA_ORIENTATION=+